MNKRKIEKIVHGSSTSDGAGVKLTRVLANRTVKDFDPFLMLDFFDSHDPATILRLSDASAQGNRDHHLSYPWQNRA